MDKDEKRNFSFPVVMPSFIAASLLACLVTLGVATVPDAILKVWCTCIEIPTLLAIRVPVAQWLDRPN